MPKWNNNYSVGVTEMDGQHKRLLELIEDLQNAMKSGKGFQHMKEVTDSLIDYTKKHFAREESLMKVVQFQGFPEHKRIHDEFIRKVSDIQKKVAEGKTSVTIETLTFLNKWVIEHIMGTDKKYGPVLNSKGIK